MCLVTLVKIYQFWLSTHILNLEFAFVQVQTAIHHVAREVYIWQPIVVQIDHSHAAAIIEVLEIRQVDGVVGSELVFERDAR